MKKIGSFKKLIISLALPIMMGILYVFFTAQAIPSWYDKFHQSFIGTPGWLFGPVWTMLYVLMGISLYMVWRMRVSRERNMALVAFIVQLLLNIGWSFLFFSFKTAGLAFMEVVALWISTVLMLGIFYQVKPVASYINIPYFFWVTFAALINASYFGLN